MKAMWQTLLARLRRLALVEEGAAVVEFALILPIMLFVYIGSVEAGAAIAMDRRVQSAAGALGDLVARSDTTIATASLDDYFKAAAGIMTPYAAEKLKQVVTQVQVYNDGTTRVDWSMQYVDGDLSEGTDHPEDSSFDLPQAMRNIARGSYVIVSEGFYEHTPLTSIIFHQPINLYRENFLMPRFGGSITID